MFPAVFLQLIGAFLMSNLRFACAYGEFYKKRVNGVGGGGEFALHHFSFDRERGRFYRI